MKSSRNKDMKLLIKQYIYCKMFKQQGCDRTIWTELKSEVRNVDEHNNSFFFLYFLNYSATLRAEQ